MTELSVSSCERKQSAIMIKGALRLGMPVKEETTSDGDMDTGAAAGPGPIPKSSLWHGLPVLRKPVLPAASMPKTSQLEIIDEVSPHFVTVVLTNI